MSKNKNTPSDAPYRGGHTKAYLESLGYTAENKASYWKNVQARKLEEAQSSPTAAETLQPDTITLPDVVEPAVIDLTDVPANPNRDIEAVKRASARLGHTALVSDRGMVMTPDEAANLANYVRK